MTLPYENASTGKNAITEMRSILNAFGCGSFGTMEDFANGNVLVQFEHRGRRVTIEASVRGYAAAWIRSNPWTSRRRCTEGDWRKRADAQAHISVWSIVRDYVKAQAAMIEIGAIHFDQAFLGQIHLPSGETVYQAIERGDVLKLGGRND